MRSAFLVWLLLMLSSLAYADEKIENVLHLCDVLSVEDGGTDTGTFNGQCILENQEKIAAVLFRTRQEIDPDHSQYEKYIAHWRESAKKRCVNKNAWCIQGAMCGHLDLACALQADIDLLQRLSCKAISKKPDYQVSPKSRKQLARYCVAKGFRY